MSITTNEVILSKTYAADYSDFTNSQSGAPKSYVDYKASLGSTDITNQINNLRFQLLGATGQSLLTAAEQKYDTIKEIADQLIVDDALQSGLNSAINQEIVDRKAGMTGAYVLLNAETARATTAENTLTTNLNNEIAARQIGISGEAWARGAADAAIQALINSETAARQIGISGEAWTRGAADTAIQALLDAETVARKAGMTGEYNARVAADNVIQANLDDYKVSNDFKLSGFSYDATNNRYAYDSSIKLNSTAGSEKYFYLSSTFRTFADENKLSIQFLNPNTGSFVTVFNLNA